MEQSENILDGLTATDISLLLELQEHINHQVDRFGRLAPSQWLTIHWPANGDALPSRVLLGRLSRLFAAHDLQLEWHLSATELAFMVAAKNGGRPLASP